MFRINSPKSVKTLLYLASSGIFCLSVSHAATDGGLPGSFLMMPVGARGGAIGPSFAAWDGDASGIFWNPALLSKTRKPELNLSQTWLFEDTSHAFMGFSYPLKDTLTLGAGYIRQASGGFERRTNPFDSPVSFSIYNEAFLGALSFKTQLNKFPLYAGFTLKGIREQVDSYSGSAPGADLGLNLEPYKNFSVSAVMLNALKPEVKLVSRKITYPSAWNLAGAYKLPERAGFEPVIGVSLLKYERQAVKPSAGTELIYKKTASLRMGLSENGISSGFGVRSGNYMLDYAVLFHEITPVHTINIAIKFGITLEELADYIKKGITRYNKEDASRLAKVYMQQAEIMHKEKNYPQAVKTLETAILWDPANRDIRQLLGVYVEEMDKTLNRQVVERTVLLALNYYEKGEFLTSREYWTSVLEMEPANPQAGQYLSIIDRKLDEKERKRALSEKLRGKEILADSLLSEATDNLKHEKYAKAILLAKKAVSTLPGKAEAAEALIAIARKGLSLSIQKRLNETELFCKNKQFKEALPLIKSVLEDDPGNKTALEKAALCKTALAPKITPDAVKKIDKLYYMAVDAYLKNNYDVSLGYLGEIFAIDPLNDMAASLEEKIKNAQKATQ